MTRRNYLTIEELEKYADITVTNDTEAEDQISQAEEIVDAFVGYPKRFITSESIGVATSGDTLNIYDTSSDTMLGLADGYFSDCEVEVIAGTNKGEKRVITTHSTTTKQVTVSEAFTSVIDSNSVYIIRQLGKFPRAKDVKILDDVYYKTIPEAVRRAVAYQVEYMINKGAEFFTDAVDYTSESLDDYSYSTNEKINKIIAPKAREILKGYITKLGTFAE